MVDRVAEPGDAEFEFALAGSHVFGVRGVERLDPVAVQRDADLAAVLRLEIRSERLHGAAV